jgi:FKBP-type peptidyl-prolyl cis-trans isomerase FkpA
MSLRRGIVAAVMLGIQITGAACGGSSSAPSCTTVNTGPVTSLQTVDVVAGTGAVATSGLTATVHYTLWLYDANAANRRGTRIESSRDGGMPFSFLVGAGRVIAGWDQGVPGMRVGGQRTLTVPTSLAYGCTGSGRIPANAALVFDIELLDVK